MASRRQPRQTIFAQRVDLVLLGLRRDAANDTPEACAPGAGAPVLPGILSIALIPLVAKRDSENSPAL